MKQDMLSACSTYHPLLGHLYSPPLVALVKVVDLTQCSSWCGPLDVPYHASPISNMLRIHVDVIKGTLNLKNNFLLQKQK